MEAVKSFCRRYRTPLIWGGVAFVILFVILCMLGASDMQVGEGPIYYFDWPIEFWFASIRNDVATNYAMQLANMIYYMELLTFTFVLAAGFTNTKHPWVFAFINVMCVEFINSFLKNLIARPRPFNTVVGEGINAVPEYNFSCPSGHAMLSMAFYGLIIWMIWNYRRDLRLRVWWCVLIGGMILAIGISRIYLGVHFTSDIIAGFCVSIIWLCFYCTIVGPLLLGKPQPPRPKLDKGSSQKDVEGSGIFAENGTELDSQDLEGVERIEVTKTVIKG